MAAKWKYYNGKTEVRIPNDEGINQDNYIQNYFCPNHICSNVDLFGLQKNNNISSYRLIANLLQIIQNLNIKKIFIKGPISPFQFF